jgi:MATE family multidrug resistance protein
MAVMLNPGALLRWAQVPADMQAEVQAYLAVLAAGLAPSLLFRLYSTLNQALGRPLLVTWLQIGSLAVKLPLSIWLVGGGAGVPAMGAVGCAWATFAVNYLMLAVALLMLRSDLYRPYRIWGPMKPPQWRQILGFARLGLPGGMAYLVEVTSFTLISLFVARLGTIATASHQIAANVTGLLYMVPLSMGIACSARVSFWIGAGQPLRARQLTLMSLRLNLLMGLVLGTALLVLRVPLAHLYSSHDAVAALAAELLLWVAIYHVADASQASSSFLLRSYRVTLLPLAIYGVVLWGLGLLGGYELSYSGLGPVPAMRSPVGFWLAGAGALVLVAVLFALLLLQASARALQPSNRFDARGRKDD